MPKDVYYGKALRKSFARIDEVRDMPNLLEIQRASYQWFWDEGLRDLFREVGTIRDHSGKLELTFTDFRIDRTPKYEMQECKARDTTYSMRLFAKVRLCILETGVKPESEIFMGDFPIMTPSGTFVINGAERVIVSQIVRSPGAYFEVKEDPKTRIKMYGSTTIPYHGAWLEYETDGNDQIWVRIDKNRKIPVTMLLRSMGHYDPNHPETWLTCVSDPEAGAETDDALREVFGNDRMINNTIDRDPAISKDSDGNDSHTREASITEIYRRLRPGDPPTVEGSERHLYDLFFNMYSAHRYFLHKVGRYKIDKKLAVWNRVYGHKLARPIVDIRTGAILYDVGTVLTRDQAEEVGKGGLLEAYVYDEHGEVVRLFGNGMVPLRAFVDIDPKEVGLRDNVRWLVLQPLLEKYGNDIENLKQALRNNADQLSPLHIVSDDIFATVNYLCGLPHGIGTRDDIDHLGNRRVRSVGELLQNAVRTGFSRMEKVIYERMTTTELENVTATGLINIRPVSAAVKEFFGSSQLSQFMDQTNPLAELTNKRRISALGTGGLSRERASFDVRDVHYSHYGRMCPIETPEGPNIGLISYLASFARVNEYGFLIAPYRKVDKATGKVTDHIDYLTADEEDLYIVAQASEVDDTTGEFIHERVAARHRDEITTVPAARVDYVDVSPRMMVSIATAMIPFLENDDANRALMGANMQRQAVPLLTTESPIVGTGMEHKVAVDSGVCILAEGPGTVVSVDATHIVVKYDDGEIKDYPIIKYARSNQSTAFNQRPIVDAGDHVEKGDVLADGPSTSNGELALGKNILVGFMTWEGYNYEDAVLLSERVVMEDVYTSIHVEEHECDCRDTKLGPEEITRDIPGVSEDALKNLDERGIITIGTEVHSGDILVGKVSPKGETDLSAEERLLRAIFGEKAREVRDTSLKLPHGEYGVVVDVKVFNRKDGDEMGPGVSKVVRIYIAQKRKISVGDKMAGRHGNKGVVSRILPREDMPYLPDGTPLDIVLNPLGVPSRMNIGQVLEVHLGYAAHQLGWKIATPVFNGANMDAIRETLKMGGLREDGKIVLRDGRTGERFDNDVTVGYVYFLKLHHLVDDKIHARSTGPYSLVTQQPLGGKAQFGGQRFGEMEVWALEAYGAAYTLQEILTVKSDDVTGRVRTYESIVKGHNIPTPGVPESFKVLVKELQALCLDVNVLDENGNPIELHDEDDDSPTSFNAVENRRDDRRDAAEYASHGYSVHDAEDLDDGGASVPSPFDAMMIGAGGYEDDANDFDDVDTDGDPIDDDTDTEGEDIE